MYSTAELNITPSNQVIAPHDHRMLHMDGKKKKTSKCASLACRVSSASRKHTRARPLSKNISEASTDRPFIFSPHDATTHVTPYLRPPFNMPPLSQRSDCVRSTDKKKVRISAQLLGHTTGSHGCRASYDTIVKDSSNPTCNAHPIVE